MLLRDPYFELFSKFTKSFTLLGKQKKFSNHKKFKFLIQDSILRVVMFEVTNYTGKFLGRRFFRFGELIPPANRLVLYPDFDRYEEFFTSATVFFCKLVRVIEYNIRIIRVSQVAHDSQKLTVLAFQVANSRRESALADQVLNVAFGTNMLPHG